MGSPALTDTTVRYLFATSWLPSDPGAKLVAVPGGSTTAIDTAGNLLHVALWSLARRGLMELERLGAVAPESVTVLGGRSSAGFRLVEESATLPGLEGALLAAARDLARDTGRLAAWADRAAGEHPNGVRLLVRALDLDHRSPWRTVCGHCFAEAAAAGLVGSRGRLFRRVVVTDEAAVELLRERNDELQRERGAYLDAAPDLAMAAMSDCLHAVAGSYAPSLGG